MTELTETQRQWIDDARAMVDWLEAHPRLIGNNQLRCRGGFISRAATFAAMAAEMGETAAIGEGMIDSYVEARLSFGVHSVSIETRASEVATTQTVTREITETVLPTIAALRAMAEAPA